MKLLSSVVWSEGMHLAPQHFQAQSRFFEDSLRAVAETFRAHAYGLAGIALDPDAIRNGTVVLVHARGIFQDGLCFLAPESDPLPEPLAVAEQFPPASDHLVVYLTVPARRDGANFAPPGVRSDSYRFFAEEALLPDNNTGRDERPVFFGRKNLSLAVGGDTHPDRVALPIARVLRDGAGGLSYDSGFIPPLLQIAANTGLMLRMLRLIEILDEKSASLAPQVAGSTGDLSTREIASFWLRHAIHSGLAALRHLWTSKRGHPEELFLELSRLAGALCTFGVDSHPRTLPSYDHDRLSDCFASLDRHIRQHLEIALPSNCISIPLQLAAPYFHEGRIIDERALGRSQWILAIRAAAPELSLITMPPQLIKFCSARFVGELVKRALPGLPLTHLSSPPPAVPRKVETQYFSVTRSGACWEHIAQTKQVGIYVPGEFPKAELELLIVLDSKGNG